MHKSVEANVVDTAERVKAILPLLRQWLPADIRVEVISDRTTTIRAAIASAGDTLLLTIPLVLLVVFLFTRHGAPTVVAAATVAVSLAATFAAMWFAGFSLDTFSLMALTIAVGFIVDDAIVVIEFILRRVEDGQTPIEAALRGVRHIGFTLVAISVSLVAVFVPLVFMGGIVGRLLHEFATTLTFAIALSALVALTLTPMLCSRLLHLPTQDRPTRWRTALDQGFKSSAEFYGQSLAKALLHPRLMIGVTVGAAILSVVLYVLVPKGLLPVQDTGLIEGGTIADPSISFTAMAERQKQVVAILLADPAIAAVGSQIGVINGFTPLNRGGLSVGLKPRDQRDASSAQVIARLQPALAALPGMQTVLDPAQDLHAGSRQGGSIQFMLLGTNLDELRTWTARLEQKLRTVPGITALSSDQDIAGPDIHLVIDRSAAAGLGVSAQAIDDALQTAFSQYQSATIYGERTQYQVILEIDPRLQTDPTALGRISLRGSGNQPVPLGSGVRVERRATPLDVRRQDQSPAATISFDPAPGFTAGPLLERVQRETEALHLPDTIRSQFGGNAKFLIESLSSQPVLIATALLSIYIALGILYESLLQPLTILSTVPSAGLGALLALFLTGTELSIVSLVGILLLMGVVKKNAIMVINLALEQERTLGWSPAVSIHAACLARFRPIVMTAFAGLLSALPLALASGAGAELRRPLGIAIVGGLILSQALTLYSTPAIYLALRAKRMPKLVLPHSRLRLGLGRGR